MRTLLIVFTIVLSLFARMDFACHAGPPVQAYHRTPGCIDGNCVPNRGTNGYHATRWRPWPGGEPTTSKPIPQVGIEPNSIQVPPREDELDIPFRPNQSGDGSTPQPSPNDRPGSGIVLPPDLRNLTPAKPVEETRPGSSSIHPSMQNPGLQLGTSPQPLLLGNKPEPLRLRSAESDSISTPDNSPPLLKVRPTGSSQSGLMPEMVPWNNEDKNPVVRQAIRITGNQVQQTIRLDEAALPDANENQMTTIRVQHETPSTPSNRALRLPQPAIESKQDDSVHNTSSVSTSSAANAPAILPNVEAQPLQPINNAEISNSSAAAISPLRGISQGNPLRR